MNNVHHGSSLDDFLRAEGNFEELQSRAVREVTAWQLGQTIRQLGAKQSAVGVEYEDQPIGD